MDEQGQAVRAPRAAERDARRARLRALLAERPGATRAELIAALPASAVTLAADLRALGVTLAPAPRQSERAQVERRARLRALLAERPGATRAELAALLGVSERMVYRDLRALGVGGQAVAARDRRRDQRRARLAALVGRAPGLGAEAAAAQLGVSVATLNRDLRALGLALAPAEHEHEPAPLPA